jgi:hypothetical protein
VLLLFLAGAFGGRGYFAGLGPDLGVSRKDREKRDEENDQKKDGRKPRLPNAALDLNTDFSLPSAPSAAS